MEAPELLKHLLELKPAIGLDADTPKQRPSAASAADAESSPRSSIERGTDVDDHPGSDDDFDVIDNTQKRACELFFHNFVESHVDGADDLLFFVTFADPHNSSQTNHPTEQHDKVRIYRKNSSAKPLPHRHHPDINWEETFCLNLIMHVLKYKLVVAVFRQNKETGKLSKTELVHQSAIYASPSFRTMSDKGTGDQISYPTIFFTVDDFDDAFDDFVLQPGDYLVINLVALVHKRAFNLFEGSIAHSAGSHTNLVGVFHKYSAGKHQRNLVSWATHGKKGAVFVAIPGPEVVGNTFLKDRNRGRAEIAVKRATSHASSERSRSLVRYTGFVSSMWSRLSRSGQTTAEAAVVAQQQAEAFPLHAFVTHISMPWPALLHRVAVQPKTPRLYSIIVNGQRPIGSVSSVGAARSSSSSSVPASPGMNIATAQSVSPLSSATATPSRHIAALARAAQDTIGDDDADGGGDAVPDGGSVVGESPGVDVLARGPSLSAGLANQQPTASFTDGESGGSTARQQDFAKQVVKSLFQRTDDADGGNADQPTHHHVSAATGDSTAHSIDDSSPSNDTDA